MRRVLNARGFLRRLLIKENVPNVAGQRSEEGKKSSRVIEKEEEEE